MKKDGKFGDTTTWYDAVVRTIRKTKDRVWVRLNFPKYEDKVQDVLSKLEWDFSQKPNSLRDAKKGGWDFVHVDKKEDEGKDGSARVRVKRGGDVARGGKKQRGK